MARKPWRDRLTPRQLRHENALALDFMRRASGKQGPASLEAFVDANKADALAPRKERAKPVLREAKILREILVALRHDPRVAMCWRQNAGTFGERYIKLGPTGMPDVVGILAPEDPPIYGGFAGRFFAIEVKAPGKKPEPHQAEMIERLRSFGCVAGVAHSVEEALGLLP